MRALRWLFAAAAMALALVFLASVACPRRDERSNPPAPETLEGLADVPPAALQGEEEPEEPLRTTVPAPELLIRVVDADTGLPLAGAELEIRRTVAEWDRPLRYAVDEHGERLLTGLDATPFFVYASHEGYLPLLGSVDPRQVLADAEPLMLQLQAGALLSGVVLATDGSPVNYGIITATRADGLRTLTVKPGHGGAFLLPALDPAAWRIDWREHIHADVDPRVVREVFLSPHRRYRAEIVIEVRDIIPVTPRPVGVVLEAGEVF